MHLLFLYNRTKTKRFGW